MGELLHIVVTSIGTLIVWESLPGLRDIKAESHDEYVTSSPLFNHGQQQCFQERRATVSQYLNKILYH